MSTLTRENSQKQCEFWATPDRLSASSMASKTQACFNRCMIKTAYILVGGRGSRLSTLFPDSIKVLAPVAGEPLLNHQLRWLSNQGIEKVVLLAGFRGEKLSEYCKRAKDFGLLRIDLEIEQEAMGSAGALKRFHRSEDEEFLVLNGGRYFSGDLREFLNLPLDPAEPCVALVKENVDSALFRSYPFFAENPQHFLAGAVIFHKKILERIPEDRFYLVEEDLLPSLAGLKIKSWDGKVADIAHPHSYAELNADLVFEKALSESSVLPLLLAVALDQGQIFVTDDQLLELLKSTSLSGLLHRWPRDNQIKRFSPRDLIIISESDKSLVDDLWRISHRCGSQVLVVTERDLEETLYDLKATAHELRSALMSYQKFWQSLEISQGWISPQGRPRRPALFMDRDGVVIIDEGYLQDPSKVRLKAEACAAIERAHARGWCVVVVTNQSGLGREYFGFEKYDAVTQKMLADLSEKGLWVDHIEVAPTYEKSKKAFGHLQRSLRKPRPGMFYAAAEHLGIDLQRSWMVGDKATDLMAAALAGLEKGFLLKSDVHVNQLEKWRSWPLLSRVSWGPAVDYGWPDFQGEEK
ncbi:MAG: HAD-IIIA family hydrolase [Proteobacteria bacterium]|nr:HAD-IIIA family hydrolase [Pseudomonadota bacterium]